MSDDAKDRFAKAFSDAGRTTEMRLKVALERLDAIESENAFLRARLETLRFAILNFLQCIPAGEYEGLGKLRVAMRAAEPVSDVKP